MAPEVVKNLEDFHMEMDDNVRGVGINMLHRNGEIQLLVVGL